MLCLGLAPRALAEDGPADRLDRLRGEIQRFERELGELGARERGVLGAVERLGAELRLRQAEHERVTLELSQVAAAIGELAGRIATLEADQIRRQRYLLFRQRELYKEGPRGALRRVAGGVTGAYLPGLRYAAYLSDRDVRTLSTYRTEAQRIRGEQSALAARRAELGTLEATLGATRVRLDGARRGQESMLARLRHDRQTRQQALEELERAADELERTVGALEPAESVSALDVRKFRGLLDWPAPGRVRAGFGSVVHPRFGTTLPHPGLDIAAEAGTDIRSIFDGRVVLATWLHGYGLTAILDHGSGILSIYAHAAALLVEPGEAVVRGQRIGMIGDSGSLQGPYLYFELRQDGRPVDPRPWLVPRR